MQAQKYYADVVRIDCLARSLPHLLEVIERLEVQSAFFRLLADSIDTSTPQGGFTLLISDAAAARPVVLQSCARCGWRGRTAKWSA